MPRRSTDISVGTDPMTPKTEEARAIKQRIRVLDLGEIVKGE